jgi:hypothetical protein
MDFVEDPSVDEGEKTSAYLSWQKALTNGSFRNDLPFLGKK